MQIDWTLNLNFFIALLAIVNPMGNFTAFLSFVADNTKKIQRILAVLFSAFIFIVMIGVYFLGETVLNLFGITIPAFRIAGGIMLVLMGIRMVYGKENLTKIHIDKLIEKKASIKIAEEKFRSLVVPVAIPLFIGPATMSTIILYANKTKDFETMLISVGVISLVTLITLLILLFSETIFSFMGENGLHIILRIMGIILLAIGIQFLINGIADVTVNLINPDIVT